MNRSIPARPSAAAPASRLAVWLSTGFGAGYLPVMPGTYGSAEGLGLYLLVAWAVREVPNGVWLLTSIAALVILLSLWTIARALPHFSSDDPSAIVLDEVAGQMIALLGIAWAHPDPLASPLGLLAGFFLFRVLDALKPYPIWKLGQWKGAAGVLADDLGAAVGAALVLYGMGRLEWL